MVWFSVEERGVACSQVCNREGERTESEGKSQQEESLEHGWMRGLINHKGTCRPTPPTKTVSCEGSGGRSTDHFNLADLIGIDYLS